ncbi:alpha-amylase family glycosyl hydrolase, partial [Bordetella pertussis]
GLRRRLPEVARLGVTLLELMPIADFPGPRNWGYDGVLPYAPDTAYGTPDELKALIDAAHGLEMGVMLDVVYNHFGPDGNYLHRYAADFFDARADTPWGAAIDYRQQAVQRYFIDNALYWLRKYRFDGLRLTSLLAPGSPALRAAIALQLLAPHIPLLFMGEEYGSTAPFFYFTSHGPELAAAVRAGRAREFAASMHDCDPPPDPNDPDTYRRSCPWPPPGAERQAWFEYYRELLR